MAYSIQTAVSDGTLEVLDLSIKYMDKSHIFVYVDDVLVDGSAYSYVWLTDTRIQLVPKVAAGSTLKVLRKTLTDEMWHEFSKGARFSTSSMDDNFEQLLFLAQEYSEGIYISDFYADVDMHLKRIMNLGDPRNDGEAVNLRTLKRYLPNADMIPALIDRIEVEEAKSSQLDTRLAAEELRTSKLSAQGIQLGTHVIVGFNATNVPDNSWVHLVGYNTPNDGGGDMFYYSRSSTQPADGGTVFAPIGGGRLFRKCWTVVGINGSVDPFMFGAKGDGTTVDTAALQAMFATGYEWYLPKTSDGFIIDDTVTIAADGTCAGFIQTVSGFNSLAVDFANPGYGSKRIVRDLEVRAASVRTPNSVGIRVAHPSIVLDRCKTTRFDYGMQVWSYSVMLLNCVSQLNNTNLSAYAPTPVSEINDLKIIGGNYDSAVEYACRLGDPRFSTTVAPGNPFGTSVTLMGANFDGAVATFDRLFGLNILGSYFEGNSSGNAIELGGAGDNYMRTVEISGCYFSRTRHAIYCKNAIQGLTVRPNYYAAIDYCALYAVNCNVSGFVYEKGASNGWEYPEVHTGFTFTTLADLKFSGITNTADFLVNGVQYATSTSETPNWYPNGRTRDGMRHISSPIGRFRTNPSTNIAGTMAGSAFTCTTVADARKFNGGDRVTGANGASFVRYVDYVTGTIYVDSFGSGAYTISHDGAAVFLGEQLIGYGAPEGVVVGIPGSKYTNLNGGAGTTVFYKASGTGNTGWVAG